MVNEVTDGIRVTEIHAQSDAGISESSAVEIGDVHGIAKEWLVRRSTRVIDQHEMQLMNVECVEFIRTILDDPIFDRPLLRNDVGQF